MDAGALIESLFTAIVNHDFSPIENSWKMLTSNLERGFSRMGRHLMGTGTRWGQNFIDSINAVTGKATVTPPAVPRLPAVPHGASAPASSASGATATAGSAFGSYGRLAEIRSRRSKSAPTAPPSAPAGSASGNNRNVWARKNHRTKRVQWYNRNRYAGYGRLIRRLTAGMSDAELQRIRGILEQAKKDLAANQH